MNRLEEYQELLNEFERPADNIEQELEGTLERASVRRKRKNLILRPVVGFAASFVIFVLLVNFSSTVAYGCSQIPGLRELARAVTFSPSLTDAVNNEYAQTMNVFDQDGDVSGKVEYLIVDQKQVNIFFRLYSDKYDELLVDPEAVEMEGDSWGSSCTTQYGDGTQNGELRSVTVDFVEGDVPERMRLKLGIRSGYMDEEIHEYTEEELEEELFNPKGPTEEEYVAHLEFDLEFDPQFTGTGKTMEVNQTATLEGQKITIEDVEIYPTHMRINISDSEENTSWLKRLDFYIVTDWGKKFEPVKEGLTATGTLDTKTLTSYRADSTYFYDANSLKLVITGAQWLRKDMEKVYVNLRTKETGELPEGVELYSTEEKEGGWIVRFKAKYREKDHFHQLMMQGYYDREGNEYSYHSWSTGLGYDELKDEEKEAYFIGEIRLTDYHQDEVWLEPAYSHEWKAKEPVVVEIK